MFNVNSFRGILLYCDVKGGGGDGMGDDSTLCLRETEMKLLGVWKVNETFRGSSYTSRCALVTKDSSGFRDLP